MTRFRDQGVCGGGASIIACPRRHTLWPKSAVLFAGEWRDRCLLRYLHVLYFALWRPWQECVSLSLARSRHSSTRLISSIYQLSTHDMACVAVLTAGRPPNQQMKYNNALMPCHVAAPHTRSRRVHRHRGGYQLLIIICRCMCMCMCTSTHRRTTRENTRLCTYATRAGRLCMSVTCEYNVRKFSHCNIWVLYVRGKFCI